MKAKCWWCGKTKCGCKIVKIGLVRSIVERPLCIKCFRNLKNNSPKKMIFGALFNQAKHLSGV